MAKAKVTEKNIKLILQGSMGKAILALAVPVVINSFLQTMYNLTDTYWLGQLGTNELAAINLVSPLQQIVVNFGSGLTVAGAVLIAQLIGASKKRRGGIHGKPDLCLRNDIFHHLRRSYCNFYSYCGKLAWSR